LIRDKKQELEKPRKSILSQIRENEIVGWSPQDSILISFDKGSYNPNDILRVIRSHVGFSAETSVWVSLETKEGEPVFHCRRIEHSYVMGNELAFKQFQENNASNPEYYDKYVAFVNGVLQDKDSVKTDLVKRMYEQFGNVEMYVGNMTRKLLRGVLESPEPRRK
jgi:hypothetical protein